MDPGPPMSCFGGTLKHLTKSALFLGILGALAFATPGCGGSDTNTSGTGGAGAGGGGNAGAAGSTTGGTGGGTGGTMSTGGTGGAGGGSSDNGAQASAFVNAGGKVKSANYQMVFTLGQSTQNQGRTASANYRMQGGIIGATGASK